MKRIAIVGLMIGSAVIGVLFYNTTTSAQTSSQNPITQEHEQLIVSRCSSVKTSLRQLHRSDASLRVNRGQLYDFIGSKLMSRLNSRLVSSRLDGGDLVDITARYDRKLSDFRSAYRVYEEQLSATLRIDCTKSPAAFYAAVLDARQKRTVVYEHASELTQIIEEYGDTFDIFLHNYLIAAEGVMSERQ